MNEVIKMAKKAERQLREMNTSGLELSLRAGLRKLGYGHMWTKKQPLILLGCKKQTMTMTREAYARYCKEFYSDDLERHLWHEFEDNQHSRVHLPELAKAIDTGGLSEHFWEVFAEHTRNAVSIEI